MGGSLIPGEFSGDGGPATEAQFASPGSVAVDAAGNLYIADVWNHRIRKVDGSGIVTTFAGSGVPCFRVEGYKPFGDGGPALEAGFCVPTGVTVDANGNVYIIADMRIRKVDRSGIITTVAGTGEIGFSGDGGPATAASLNHPQDLATDAAGNLYIADIFNHRIRKIDTDGIITTIAGTGPIWFDGGGYSGDGGPAVRAYLRRPSNVAVDGYGNVYIADNNNHRIRKVDTAGIITTIAGTGPIGFDEGGYSGDDGPAVRARLHSPLGVAVDSTGNLYIADSGNYRVRRIDREGIITTIAGTGERGFSGDGGPASRARLGPPRDVAMGIAGSIYIADSFNHRIRRLTQPNFRISSGGVVLATGLPVVDSISPNALISVFGQDFAPEGTLELSPRLDDAGRVAGGLGDACLEIDGKRAPLFAVFPTQINAQVPSGLAAGRARVAVVRNCGAAEEERSLAAAVEVGAVSPAFFNFPVNPDGRNPLVAMHGGGPALAGQPGLIPGVALTPAEPGEVVTFFGTGFGRTEPALQAGEIPARVLAHTRGLAPLADEVSFTVGGFAVPPWDVLYAGAAPCCAGLQQFAVRLPPILEDGHAPVTAAVQGVSTPEGPFLAIRRVESEAAGGQRLPRGSGMNPPRLGISTCGSVSAFMVSSSPTRPLR